MSSMEQIPVATWVRVSDDKSDVAAQRRKIRERVQSMGYDVQAEFDLPPVSGSKGRPKHEQALAEVTELMRAGRVKLLVIFHSSRLDRRDELDQAQFLLDVFRAGGEIDSIEEGESFGRRSRMSRAMSVLKQGENADYSTNLSSFVRKTNDDNDARGAFRGRAPIGYMVRCGICSTVSRGSVRCLHRGSKQLVPDPEVAPVIVDVFRRIAASQSVPVIVRWLAEVHGISRTNSSVASLVRNKLYVTGHHNWTDHAGRLQTHITEPLVSPALWQAANDDMASRPSTHAHPRAAHAPDYSGSLYCEQGHRVYRCFSGNGPRLRYYRCGPCRISWRADAADEQTEEIMFGNTSSEWTIQWVEGGDHTTEIERAQSELDDLPKRRLSRADEQAERERLWARLDELQDLPVTAPRRELTRTGRTMADAWESWTHAERAAYLRAGQFQIQLSGRGKDVHAELVWLVQKIDVKAGADLGDGMRGTIVMGGMPVLWSDE